MFSRNFYLPLLKPLTPSDALRTFRITGKWLLGSKIQHYIPTLLNHTKKRSKKSKNYGKILHKFMEDYTYMTPVLDPDNIESQKNLLKVLNGGKSKGAFVYTVDDKNYNLVIDASLEFAIRDGEVIDVLMSQGTDKILIKLKDFRKIPVEIQEYTKNEKLYKGEGTTSKEDERFHHHGKYTMKIAKIFEDMERKEEQWEIELKRLMQKRKKKDIESTKEWKEMLKAATANMDWKKYEKQAKRIVQYIEEPIVEYHIGMEVTDVESTKIELFESTDKLPTLEEIPELINHLEEAILHQDPISNISGALVTLSSGKECFVVGQMVKTEDGEFFVPGQTVENEMGVEYAPGITIQLEDKPTLINGLIVGDSDNKNPMFAAIESTITEAGHLSFAVIPEDRTKYRPRKVPVRKVIKNVNQYSEDTYEEYYYDDDEAFDSSTAKRRNVKIKVVRVMKKRKVPLAGCVYNAADEATYLEEEYSDYEKIEVEEDEEYLNELIEKDGKSNAVEGVANLTEDEVAEPEPSLEEILENYKKQVDPRIKANREYIEEEKMRFKVMNEKITELVVNIESKKEEVKEKLEELRNLTVVKEIDPISSASIEDAIEIASNITNHLPDVNVISDILLTMVRRVLTFSDKNSINIENINNSNEMGVDERNQRCEKLKITLKTAMVAANNVFKNRPQDEVSALKAIGTVLMLALQDQDKLIAELCQVMNDPLERSETCVLLLKELAQKRQKSKLKDLKKIVDENEDEIQDDTKVIEKLKDVLDKQGDRIGPAFKKMAKNNPDLLKKVIELVKADVDYVKTENCATQTLEDAIVSAVKEEAADGLRVFLKTAEQSEIEEFIAEAMCFSHVLGLNGAADAIVNLKTDPRLSTISNKTCLELLKRLMIIRKLAECDNGQTKALREIKKNPEFARNNPRIRQLIRESAALVSNAALLKNSKQIPDKLFNNENVVALEDFLIQKSRIQLPVLVSRSGKQAVLPQELTKDVLEGSIPYVMIDEDGITNIKAVKKFVKGMLNNKNYEKSIDDYSPFGSMDKKKEEWAEVPNYRKLDVRNRARRLSNTNHRMAA